MTKHPKTNDSWRERQHAASDRTVKRFAVGLAISLGIFASAALTYFIVISPYKDCGYDFGRDLFKKHPSPSTNSLSNKVEIDLLKPYILPSKK